MPRVKDQAFIISKREFGESDLIITLFSLSRGRVSAIAKGAKRSRKRFPGVLETFSKVNFSGFIKHPLALTRIDECRLIEPYSGLQESLAGYYCGCYFLEIVSRCCPERQANPALFHLLDEILLFLAESSSARRRNFSCQIRLFELQAIALLGFKPHLDHCLECHRQLSDKIRLCFSPRAGGLVCDACRPLYPESFQVSRGTINLLNRAAELDRDIRAKLNFTPAVENESARLCRALLRWHSGCEFKSLQILEQKLQKSKSGKPQSTPSVGDTKTARGLTTSQPAIGPTMEIGPETREMEYRDEFSGRHSQP